MSIRDDVRRAPGYRFETLPHSVKLDQNEAPEDLPPELRAEALERVASAAWNRYPPLRPDGVANALAARDGWDPAGVIVANGSNVLIQALLIAAGIGRRVLTVSPTFGVYEAQARLLGVDLRTVPLRMPGFGLDVGGLRRELASGPGVLFLPDPAAPTGNRLDDAAVEDVLEAAAQHDWTAVVDEAYWPYDGRHRLDSVRGHPDRISLRTLSKADGLGGVRLGYALAHPDTAAHVAKVLLPFTVSSLQAAVVECVLEAGDDLRRARIRATRAERERIRGELAALPGVEVFPAVTNFLLFRVDDAAAVYAALLQDGVLVRRQDHMAGLTGCLRVTVGTPEENDAFLAAVRRVATMAAGR